MHVHYFPRLFSFFSLFQFSTVYFWICNNYSLFYSSQFWRYRPAWGMSWKKKNVCMQPNYWPRGCERIEAVLRGKNRHNLQKPNNFQKCVQDNTNFLTTSIEKSRICSSNLRPARNQYLYSKQNCEQNEDLKCVIFKTHCFFVRPSCTYRLN